MKSKASPTNGGTNPLNWDEVLLKYTPLVSARIRYWNCSFQGIEAEDILQEVRIKLWKTIEHGEQIRCFSAYLRKVTDSVIISYFRKIKNTIEYKDKRVTSVDLLLKSNEKNCDLPIMARLIYARLPLILENRRIVLSLYLSGFTFKEIAEYKEFTIDKTRVLYYRGVRDVKMRIQGVVRNEAGAPAHRAVRAHPLLKRRNLIP